MVKDHVRPPSKAKDCLLKGTPFNLTPLGRQTSTQTPPPSSSNRSFGASEFSTTGNRLGKGGAGDGDASRSHHLKTKLGVRLRALAQAVLEVARLAALQTSALSFSLKIICPAPRDLSASMRFLREESSDSKS
jgi:hypothetical protein